jgi:hypothetical protein
MLLPDIVSLLNEEFRQAHVIDDERIDRRIIQDWVMLKRNTWTKNHINQTGNFEQNMLQFEILDVDIYNPSLVLGGVDLGKTILRTDPCPTIIEGRSGPAIYELTSPDIISRTIQSVSFDRLRWCGNGKINKHLVFGAFYDGRFYLKSGSEMEKPITKLHIVAVFADPTQVSTYNIDTDDYPVNDYFVDYMLTDIRKNNFQFLESNKTDDTNNASGVINGN